MILLSITPARATTKNPAIPSQTGEPQTESDANRLTRQANRLFAAGDLKGAAQTYRRALQAAPNDAQLHFNLALALGALGDRQEERHELERALHLQPELAAAHNQLGLLAVQAGDAPEAEKEFQAAISANPKYAEALNNLGVLYSRQGRDSDAIETFRQATQADPDSSEAWVNLGLTLTKTEGFSKAESELQSAIDAKPEQAGPYTALGVVRSRAGRGADAVAPFQKAVQLQPKSSDAHLNLGIALVEQDFTDKGLKELTAAVKLNPNSAAAHMSLGHLYFVTGRYTEARTELRMACRLQPTLEDGFYFLALAERQDNNIEKAAELSSRVVALNPANADAQFLLGQCLDKLGKTDQAIEHWKLAVQTDSNESQALYSLARALARRQDPGAKVYQDRFDEIKKRNLVTDRVTMLRSFALEAAHAQNWPQAIDQMQQAIQSCGGCSYGGILHKNMAYLYRSTGKLNDAKTELQKALAIDPNDLKAQAALADLSRLAGSEP